MAIIIFYLVRYLFDDLYSKYPIFILKLRLGNKWLNVCVCIHILIISMYGNRDKFQVADDGH